MKRGIVLAASIHSGKHERGMMSYSKYNFVIRLVMRWIAKGSGSETDTLRDYEYTDWSRLDQFVNPSSARFDRTILKLGCITGWIELPFERLSMTCSQQSVSINAAT